MMISACLIILSALCSLDRCAHAYAPVAITGDRVKKLLSNIPPKSCNQIDTNEVLHFGDMIIDNRTFELFCKKDLQGIFFLATIRENGLNEPEGFTAEVKYDTQLRTLEYLNSKGKREVFSDHTLYELDPLGVVIKYKSVKYLIFPSTVVYENQVALQSLKSDLDGMWSFLKEHCQNKASSSKHVFVISVGNVVIPAEFQCESQTVNIRKTETTQMTKFLINGEEFSDDFSTYYNLKTGEFSAPLAWGLVQFRPALQDVIFMNTPNTLQKIRYPLQVFEQDMQDIRKKLTDSSSKDGVVVDDEVLIKISKTRKKDGSGDAIVKVEAETLAPEKSLYLSQNGFSKASLFGGSKMLNIQDYYIEGKFEMETLLQDYDEYVPINKNLPKYLSEYVRMGEVRKNLGYILDHTEMWISENDKMCFKTIDLVYHRRVSLEIKVDVCKRNLEFKNLHVLRLQRGSEVLAFKSTYEFAYFLRENFATKDGALEDALSVRFKRFDESTCKDCETTLLYKYWTIHVHDS